MAKKLRDSGLPRPMVHIARAALRRIAVKNNVVVGSGFRAGRSVVISAPHRLEIGRWVSVGPRTLIQCDGKIGDFALIGMGVQIVGREDHAIDSIGVPIARAEWAGHRPMRERDKIDIGRDVWIGGGSVVLSGISIGEGSIIGSGSVVTRDVPPFTIVAGNPAKAIRQRFSHPEEQIRHTQGLNAFAESLG